jgi:lipopolysaccharide/colanic/teichoic acid biosynthesis glycosyltransferase
VFTALLRTWIPGGLIDGHQRVLLMGFDRLTAALASALREAPAGVENTPLEAGATNLGELCAARNTRSLVLSSKHPGASFRQLLQLHYSGIEVEGAPLAYERILQRVPWEYVEPSELLFFLNPSTSPAMLAFQAIYKNVLGLTLRVVFAPLLILTSVMIVVFTGGPALEHIECLGFRRIPFQMLRFRIRRSDGSRSWIGDLIERFRLTNLPQLINVVRGEMTLFGPAPVRTAFANRLCQLLPAYPFRFTVKPGIFGWPKACLDETGSVPDEALLLELDLYYVRQESPSLDLDILLRMMFRRPPARRSAA